MADAILGVPLNRQSLRWRHPQASYASRYRPQRPSESHEYCHCAEPLTAEDVGRAALRAHSQYQRRLRPPSRHISAHCNLLPTKVQIDAEVAFRSILSPEYHLPAVDRLCTQPHPECHAAYNEVKPTTATTLTPLQQLNCSSSRYRQAFCS